MAEKNSATVEWPSRIRRRYGDWKPMSRPQATAEFVEDILNSPKDLTSDEITEEAVIRNVIQENRVQALIRLAESRKKRGAGEQISGAAKEAFNRTATQRQAAPQGPGQSVAANAQRPMPAQEITNPLDTAQTQQGYNYRLAQQLPPGTLLEDVKSNAQVELLRQSYQPAEKPMTEYQKESLRLRQSYLGYQQSRGRTVDENMVDDRLVKMIAIPEKYQKKVETNRQIIEGYDSAIMEFDKAIQASASKAKDNTDPEGASKAYERQLELIGKRNEALEKKAKASDSDLLYTQEANEAWTAYDMFTDSRGSINYADALKKVRGEDKPAKVEKKPDIVPNPNAGKPLTPEAVAEAKMKFPNDKEAARNWLISQGYNVQ